MKAEQRSTGHSAQANIDSLDLTCGISLRRIFGCRAYWLNAGFSRRLAPVVLLLLLLLPQGAALTARPAHQSQSDIKDVALVSATWSELAQYSGRNSNISRVATVRSATRAPVTKPAAGNNPWAPRHVSCGGDQAGTVSANAPQVGPSVPAVGRRYTLRRLLIGGAPSGDNGGSSGPGGASFVAPCSQQLADDSLWPVQARQAYEGRLTSVSSQPPTHPA